VTAAEPRTDEGAIEPLEAGVVLPDAEPGEDGDAAGGVPLGDVGEGHLAMIPHDVVGEPGGEDAGRARPAE
jgi:hypothetical protein